MTHGAGDDAPTTKPHGQGPEDMFTNFREMEGKKWGRGNIDWFLPLLAPAGD